MIPKHTAIIMDGNGRWAEQKGMPRVFGHQNGVKTVRKIVEEANKLKIKFLTLYTFSVENWERPNDEINTLMNLLIDSLKDEFEDIFQNNIKLNAVGELSSLPVQVQKELFKIIEEMSFFKSLISISTPSANMLEPLSRKYFVIFLTSNPPL